MSTTTAVKPAVKRTRKPAVKPANPVLTPAQEAELKAKAEEAKFQARLAELKSAYTAARDSEKGAKGAVRTAREMWANTRVITSRISYAIAMLKPNEEGKPNLSFAAREMHMTDAQLALTGDDYKKAQKAANSTMRNYVAAGLALFEAGQDPENRKTEPDAVEREIVAAAFKAGNTRNTTTNPGAGTTEKGAEKGTEKGADAPDAPDALTFADLNGQLGRMENTLKTMMATKVAVTPDEARHALAALGTLAMTLSEYVGLDAVGDEED